MIPNFMAVYLMSSRQYKMSRSFRNLFSPDSRKLLMSHFLYRSFFLVFLSSLSLQVYAAKTDIVFLKNGDRVTGEVKSLEKGKLEFSTDHMGTVHIECEDIQEIVSDIGQTVELTNGQRFYGPLAKPDSGDLLMVDTTQGTVGVGINDVISMYPVEATFWERLDISASLGFSWDKASSVGKYNLGVEAEYRNPRFITRADLSTEVTTQEGRDDTGRAQFELSHLVYRQNKRYHQIFGMLESNDELGIDLRTLLGAGYGWVPIRSQKNWFSVGTGLAVNHEVPQAGDSETNLEAVASMTYDYYQYSHPERRFRVDLLVFPSLTDFGRWRANFNTNFTLEFIKDLYWKLDIYASYDSDPVSFRASSSDYGVISSLAYKF
jgi:hypothetical protein